MLLFLLFFIIFIFGIIIGYLINLYYNYYSFISRQNDYSDERRKYYNNNENYSSSYFIPSNIIKEQLWEPNSRGYLIHQQIFIPKDQNIKGVILICHGFGDHSLDFLTEIALKFVNKNYAIITLDAEGHGLSDGLHGYIENLKLIASDYSDFLIKQSKRECFKSKPFFVYGGSMGGAITFYLCTIFPCKNIIQGVIFASPMVKISDKMRPHPILTTILTLLGYIFPFAPIVPVPSITHKCFKRQDNLQRSLKCKLAYRKYPRLWTAGQLLEATDDITNNMKNLKHPFLILHGEHDVVTCPQNSELLYQTSESTDKTIKIYEKAWHSLLVGEYEPEATKIFEDIMTWLERQINK